MADQEIGALKISLSLQEADFSKSMGEITRKIRGVNSEFKVAAAGVDGFDKTLAGMQANSRRLTSILELQRSRVASLKSEYDRASNSAEINQKEVDNLSKRYNNSVAAMKNTEAQLGRVNKQIAEQSTFWGRAAANADRFRDVGDRVSATGSTMMRTFGVATTAIGGGLGLAAKSAMDFESQMSGVKSVMAPDEVRRYSKELENLAIVQGSKTAYSATQAAQAEEELVKAGVSVKDIIHGGLSGALNLATAGSLNLKDAAEIASTALNAFKNDNLSVSQAADILAGAANASATDVGELKFGLSAVSTVAAGVGWSFKDTSTALAEFAQNGLKGQDAGTSLKTMLLNLQPQTTKAAGAMKDLGLITKDGNNLFIDAHGRFKNLADISEILRTHMDNLTEAQQQQALKTMFGTDAVRASNILMREGAKGATDMATAISKISAADVAKQKLDNMKGTLEQLRGSLETAGITVGNALLPSLRSLTKDVQGVVDWFNKLDPATQQWIAKAALGTTATLGVGTAMGAMTMAIGGGIKQFGSLAIGINAVNTAFREVKAARAAESVADIGAGASGAAGKVGTLTKGAGLLTGAIGALTSPVGLVTLGIGAAGLAAYGLYHHFTKIQDTSTAAADAIGKQRAELTPLINRYDELTGKSKLTSNEFGRFVDIQSQLKKTSSANEIKKLKDEADQLQNKSGLSNKQLSEMVDLNGKLVKSVPGATDKITDQGNRIAENTKKAKAYNSQLLEQQLRELEIKKNAAEGNEAKYKKEIANLQSNLNVGLAHENDLSKIANYLNEHGVEATKEHFRYRRDINQLLSNNGASLKSQLSTMMSQNDEAKKKIGYDKEQLDRSNQLKANIANVYLKSVGITEQGHAGISALAQQVEKLKQQGDQLAKNHASGKLSTAQYNQGREAIQGQIDKLTGVGHKISNATDGAYSLNKELRKDINKDVNSHTHTDGTYKSLDNAVSKSVNVKVNKPKDYYNLTDDITKNLYVKVHASKLQEYVNSHATGARNIPHDEVALVGEAGREFVHDKKFGTYLVNEPTIVPLSAGSSVLKNADTERLGKALGLRGFAVGVGDAFDSLMNRYVPDVSQTAAAPQVTVNNDNSALLMAMKQQLAMAQQTVDLLAKILMKDPNINLNPNDFDTFMSKRFGKMYSNAIYMSR
ncbi:phage tail tape measure protein [Sporolactobacillus kofuensis]|uniref:Phage tail tape measure protein n=1 Tax=Sporolactobacillus kofuensis TaxID=269672 RepID=A0ABW1WA53_9BACL|nr:phage tail tape measure protein [Sporolactobacillus kofuensis]MCO7175561.1 phage tail tape measure protein [Sporolactobacillus kofuensis]